MKIGDQKKSYFIIFLIGMAVGVLCRLTDFFAIRRKSVEHTVSRDALWVLDRKIF